MWSELLGFGDFYCELGVQAVEACMAHRPVNGGLMEINELVEQVSGEGSAFLFSLSFLPLCLANVSSPSVERCSHKQDCVNFFFLVTFAGEQKEREKGTGCE